MGGTVYFRRSYPAPMKASLFVLLCLPCWLFGQSPLWSAAHPLPENALPAGVCWSGDGVFVGVHTLAVQAGAIFEKFSATDGRLLDRREIVFEKLTGLEEVFSWRGRIFLLVARYRYNRTAELQYAAVQQPDFRIPPDSMELSLRALDPITLLPDGDSVCLVPMHFRENKSHRAVLAFSPDSSRMACALLPDYPHERFPGTTWLLDTPGDRFRYAVVDDRLDLLRTDTAQLPVRRLGEQVRIRDWAVDNRGDVAMAADVCVREGDYRPGEPPLRPTLFFLPLGEQKTRFYEIQGSEYLHSLTLRFDAADRLYCTALYSPTDHGHSRGVFWLKIDAAKEKILQRKLVPFPDTVLSPLIGQRRAKRSGQLEWLDLYHVERCDDGGMLFVAEVQQAINEAYQYGLTLVFRLQPNGDWAWGKGFPKSLSETGAAVQFLSFSLKKKEKKHYLFFNQSTRLDGSAVCYELDDQGNCRRTAQWKHDDHGQFLLCPTLTRTSPNGRFVLLGLKRQRGQFKWGFFQP
jgi:hypothetical protein